MHLTYKLIAQLDEFGPPIHPARVSPSLPDISLFYNFYKQKKKVYNFKVIVEGFMGWPQIQQYYFAMSRQLPICVHN